MDVESGKLGIAGKLLAWYDHHARALPWRSLPGSPAPDPYYVWLSEIMLQQTTVAAVIPYFERFTSRWPTVEALAAADDADVMAAWAGLGYYARARNLLACARIVVAGKGKFPDTEAGLRALPGIGAYTAAAIAAIAFGRRAVVVDGNIERVVARLFAIEEPLPLAKRMLYGLTGGITPDARAGDFAQAMMDLGATICTPRAPKCLVCPLRAKCRAEQPELLPKKLPKRARAHRIGTVWWVERSATIALVRRPTKGLLGGMRALPGTPWIEGTAPVTALTVTHGFTHFDLTLSIERRDASACQLPLETEWWPVSQLAEAGLPTVFMKAVQAVLREEANVRHAA